jgi:hypothetical protein
MALPGNVSNRGPAGLKESIAGTSPGVHFQVAERPTSAAGGANNESKVIADKAADDALALSKEPVASASSLSSSTTPSPSPTAADAATSKEAPVAVSTVVVPLHGDGLRGASSDADAPATDQPKVGPVSPSTYSFTNPGGEIASAVQAVRLDEISSTSVDSAQLPSHSVKVTKQSSRDSRGIRFQLEQTNERGENEVVSIPVGIYFTCLGLKVKEFATEEEAEIFCSNFMFPQRTRKLLIKEIKQRNLEKQPRRVIANHGSALTSGNEERDASGPSPVPPNLPTVVEAGEEASAAPARVVVPPNPEDDQVKTAYLDMRRAFETKGNDKGDDVTDLEPGLEGKGKDVPGALEPDASGPTPPNLPTAVEAGEEASAAPARVVEDVPRFRYGGRLVNISNESITFNHYPKAPISIRAGTTIMNGAETIDVPWGQGKLFAFYKAHIEGKEEGVLSQIITKACKRDNGIIPMVYRVLKDREKGPPCFSGEYSKALNPFVRGGSYDRARREIHPTLIHHWKNVKAAVWYPILLFFSFQKEKGSFLKEVNHPGDPQYILKYGFPGALVWTDELCSVFAYVWGKRLLSSNYGSEKRAEKIFTRWHTNDFTSFYKELTKVMPHWLHKKYELDRDNVMFITKEKDINAVLTGKTHGALDDRLKEAKCGPIAISKPELLNKFPVAAMAKCEQYQMCKQYLTIPDATENEGAAKIMDSMWMLKGDHLEGYLFESKEVSDMDQPDYKLVYNGNKIDGNPHGEGKLTLRSMTRPNGKQEVQRLPSSQPSYEFIGHFDSGRFIRGTIIQHLVKGKIVRQGVFQNHHHIKIGMYRHPNEKREFGLEFNQHGERSTSNWCLTVSSKNILEELSYGSLWFRQNTDGGLRWQIGNHYFDLKKFYCAFVTRMRHALERHHGIKPATVRKWIKDWHQHIHIPKLTKGPFRIGIFYDDEHTLRKGIRFVGNGIVTFGLFVRDSNETCEFGIQLDGEQMLFVSSHSSRVISDRNKYETWMKSLSIELSKNCGLHDNFIDWVKNNFFDSHFRSTSKIARSKGASPSRPNKRPRPKASEPLEGRLSSQILGGQSTILNEPSEEARILSALQLPNRPSLGEAEAGLEVGSTMQGLHEVRLNERFSTSMGLRASDLRVFGTSEPSVPQTPKISPANFQPTIEASGPRPNKRPRTKFREHVVGRLSSQTLNGQSQRLQQQIAPPGGQQIISETAIESCFTSDGIRDIDGTLIKIYERENHWAVSSAANSAPRSTLVSTNMGGFVIHASNEHFPNASNKPNNNHVPTRILALATL